MNIIKHRYLYFLISLVVILPGVIALALWGLPLGIDFTGGRNLRRIWHRGRHHPGPGRRRLFHPHPGH